MTEDEIKSKLSTLINELISIPSEEREGEIVMQITEISPDPEWSDYIFHSSEFYNGTDLDVGKVVKKILTYKAIQL